MIGPRFDCRDVDRLLDLDDLGLRPDRQALAKHMSRCARCRELAPELEWFYGRLRVETEVESGRKRSRLRILATCCFFVAAALPFVFVEMKGEVLPLEVHELPPAEAKPRLLPAHQSHFENGVIRTRSDHDQQSKTSSVTTSSQRDENREAEPMEWTR